MKSHAFSLSLMLLLAATGTVLGAPLDAGPPASGAALEAARAELERSLARVASASTSQ